MAAPARKMVADSEDSSSSDDEQLRRCQEAVWETQPLKTKDADSNVKQSKRIVVAEHEHDGNELQVTRGFQTHVAKKLDHLLDSLISEKQPETSTCVESAKCGGDEDDEGFRLFSTSVPGQSAEEPPVHVRRRPIPSSSDSDSDMETRLKEAAVSIKDLLPAFSLPSTESKEEISCSDKTKKKKKKKKKAEEGEENRIIKKKKKLNQEETETVDSESAHNGQNNGDHNDSDNAQTQVKVKKKKKKRKSTEANTKGEVSS